MSAFWERWWYPKAPETAGRRFLLAPLSLASLGYRFASWRRHRRIARGHRGARVPGPRIVSVGSLYIGGAGKTPAVIHLAQRSVALGHKVVVITRGWGRRVREPVALVPGEPVPTYERAGDEPLLIARRCPGVVVLVGPDRHALALAARDSHRATLILLDDGFQQCALRPDEDWLVLDEASGFGNGHLVPRGPLRDPPSAIARASLLWLRASDGMPRTRWAMPHVRARYTPGPLVTASGTPQPREALRGAPVVAFAGLARPRRFFDDLTALGADVRVARGFPDHHRFTPGELRELRRQAAVADARLVTTEKDLMRLPADFPALALRLEVELMEGAALIDERLRTG